jgi:hypothetical protein
MDRLSRLKKRWTNDENEFLLKNYGSLKAIEIAIALGRTKAQVMSRITYLSLSNYKGKAKKWTKLETDMLILLYNKKVELKEIVRILDKESMQVSNKIQHLRRTKKING